MQRQAESIRANADAAANGIVPAIYCLHVHGVFCYVARVLWATDPRFSRHCNRRCFVMSTTATEAGAKPFSIRRHRGREVSMQVSRMHGHDRGIRIGHETDFHG